MPGVSAPSTTGWISARRDTCTSSWAVKLSGDLHHSITLAPPWLISIPGELLERSAQEGAVALKQMVLAPWSSRACSPRPMGLPLEGSPQGLDLGGRERERLIVILISGYGVQRLPESCLVNPIEHNTSEDYCRACRSIRLTHHAGRSPGTAPGKNFLDDLYPEEVPCRPAQGESCDGRSSIFCGVHLYFSSVSSLERPARAEQSGRSAAGDPFTSTRGGES